MQAINSTVLNPVFLGIFAGTALLGGALVVRALTAWGRSGSLALAAGGALYALGTFVVTMAANVPRNDRLASLGNAASPEAAALWADYLASWTAWNHVRTAAALLAAAFFVVGVFQEKAA
jgi:uncharacterized membrane protein